MKKYYKRLISFKIPTYIIASIAVLAFLAASVPIVRLMFYARPLADDFWYGSYVKMCYERYGTIQSIFAGIRWCVTHMWKNWQGTFSSAAMMSVMPGIWNEKFYFTGLLLIYLSITVGSFILTRTVAKCALKADFAEQTILGIIVATTLVERMYTAQPGLYWYNGAVHYTFMHGMMFLLIAAEVKLLYSKKLSGKVVFEILGCFLAVVVGGSNFATCLQGLVIYTSVLLLGIIFKNKRTWLAIPPFIVGIIATCFNVFAPGNVFREACFEGKGAIESILLSFQSAFENLTTFLILSDLLLIAMAAPIFIRLTRKLNFDFRLPGLVTLYSFCIYACGFTSSWYGMGTAGISRTWNVIKYTLIVLLFINFAYWTGWITHRFTKKTAEEKEIEEKKGYNPLYYMLPILGVLICFVLSPNPIGHYLSYGAYYYVHTGEANEYAKEYDAIVEKVKSVGQYEEVWVEPLHFRPWFLCGSGNLEADSLSSWYYRQVYYKE